jgi:excinuclease ABC subunit A
VRNPRSTVGTTTEIHDYLRLLYARVGRTICRRCGQPVTRETAEIVARRLNGLPQGTRLLVGFDMPVVAVSGAEEDEPVEEIAALNGERPGHGAARRASGVESIRATLGTLRKKGFHRLFVDGTAVVIDDLDPATLQDRSALQVVVDRIKIDGDLQARLTDSIEIAYLEGGGAAFAIEVPRTEPAGRAPLRRSRGSRWSTCSPSGSSAAPAPSRTRRRSRGSSRSTTRSAPVLSATASATSSSST